MKKAIGLFAFTLCMPGFCFGMYKCIASSGAVAYQGAPCKGGDAEKKIKAQAQGQPTALIKTDSADVDRRLKIRTAIQNGEPLISMTSKELEDAMGLADTINSSNYGRGLEEQHIFHRRGRTIYVYTQNGIVTSIQNTEGLGRRKEPCPPYSEIRNIEVDMSSITNRGNERQRDLQKRLDFVRSCYAS